MIAQRARSGLGKVRISHPEKLRSPLPVRPSAKQVKDRLSEYLDLVAHGETVEVRVRRKHVATLAPPAVIEGQRTRTITASDIKEGRRNFTSVAINGPYLVERRGVKVAALFAPDSLLEDVGKHGPVQKLIDSVSSLVEIAGECQILDESRRRRVELRARLDRMIVRKIQLLERLDAVAAEAFRKEFEMIDRDAPLVSA